MMRAPQKIIWSKRVSQNPRPFWPLSMSPVRKRKNKQWVCRR